MRNEIVRTTAVSGQGGTAKNLLSGLTEGKVLPQYRIYNSISDELITSFSYTNGWHLVVDEGGVASSVFREGVLKIDIAEGGRTWYAIQVCCLPLPLSAGYWTVIFEARSDVPRRMILDIAHIGDDWFAFAGRPVFRLMPEWTTYEFSFFNEKQPEPMARFEFNLGGENVSAEFSNLRIIRES